MNDVGRDLYGLGKTDIEEQQKYLNSYYKNMTKLLAKFDGIDSDVIFLTPTIYDQTVKLKTENKFGVNDALAQCAEFVKLTAKNREQGYVDFYDSMLSINAQLQQEEPSATIVGLDRVHPNVDFGHFIMAYQFLKAQGVPKYVSKIVLDVESRMPIEVQNASLELLKTSSDSASFSALENSLPFPQTESIAKALGVVPFEAEMNQEVLVVQGLEDGMYSLSIDGIEIGSWSAAQFAEGINLAIMNAAPQYQQALKVKKLNDRRCELDVLLRDVAYVYYSSGLSKSCVDLEDVVAVEAFLQKKLKSLEGQPWYGYVKQKYSSFVAVSAKQPDIRNKLVKLHDSLYQANQPVQHHFSISKVYP